MVCDGFIGNILLKSAEGLASSFYRILREEMKSNPLKAWAARAFLGTALSHLKKRLDYSEWGGAPLLGIDGNVVICHGRSNANAIKNAIYWGLKMVQENMSKVIGEEVRASGGASGSAENDQTSPQL